MQRIAHLILGVSLSLGLSSQLLAQAADFSKDSSSQRILIAAKTETFKEKEGFNRKPKDIINTLKDNEVAGFSTMLDGLTQAYGLDKTLKDNGPYTFFAVSDGDFKSYPMTIKMSFGPTKRNSSKCFLIT